MLSKFFKKDGVATFKTLIAFFPHYTYQTKKNLYDILGVNHKCTSEEIKKSYYSLAQKYHPDKNDHPNASDKFNEITHAYDILIDEKQRRLYDSYGGSSKSSSSYSQTTNEGPKSSKTGFSSNFSSSFEEDLFQDFDKFFYSKTSQSSSQKTKKGKDISIELQINFMESVTGCSKSIAYTRQCWCEICKGSRCRPGTHPTKCYTCGGKGNVIYRSESEEIEETCEKCEGLGKNIKYKCDECKGKGFINKTVNEKIVVPVGVGHEQILRKEGHGDIGLNMGKNGDLFIKVLVEDDPYFKREGNDIYTKCPLTISQAVLGAKLNVKTLRGIVEINVDKGTMDGDKMKLSNLGIQKLNNPQNRGNHYVVFNLKVPEKLNERQYSLYRELSKFEENST